MTVRELRQLLFDVEDQEAEVHFAKQITFGVVTDTIKITKVGHRTDPAGYVSIQ